jgi:tetratricopeptide (TPR) repeat protein
VVIARRVALGLALVCAGIGARVAGAAEADPADQASPPADAQAKARAQALLREGTTAYGHGDYAAALDKFTAAYAIFPSPKLWFNIGQANRDLGRPVEAVAAFDRFLREAEDAPPETLAEARRSSGELKTKLGQITVTCAIDGADVTVDGKPVGSTPLGELIWTTPGHHQLAVQHPGYSPAIEDVNVTAGDTTAVNVELRAIDLHAQNPEGGGANVGDRAAADEGRPIYKEAWFWIAVGVAVAIGAGVAVLIASRNDSGSGGLGTTLGAQMAF